MSIACMALFGCRRAASSLTRTAHRLAGDRGDLSACLAQGVLDWRVGRTYTAGIGPVAPNPTSGIPAARTGLGR